MRPERILAGLAVLVCAGAVATSPPGATDAAFTAPTASAATASATEWTPPTVEHVLLAKAAGGTSGTIGTSVAYHVYATATDTGGPTPSGVATVRADLTSITTGQAAATLSPGSWTVGGTTYTHRSAQLTSDAAPGDGDHDVTATDAAGNASTTSSTATVDTTPPGPATVEAGNGSGQVGVVDAGDVVTLAFTEPVEPSSVMAGWDGSATSVTVRVTDGGGGDDTLRVLAPGGATLPLGVVHLARDDYVDATREMVGSTMSATATGVTITLTAPDGTVPQPPGQAPTGGTLGWTPDADVIDLAGNRSTGSTTEADGDRDF